MMIKTSNRAYAANPAVAQLPKSPKTQAFEGVVMYYGYRFYDPETGRWPSRDPIEEEGGINLYGFVGNDGVNGWDYLGMSAEVEVLVGGLGIGLSEALKAELALWAAAAPAAALSVVAVGSAAGAIWAADNFVKEALAYQAAAHALEACAGNWCLTLTNGVGDMLRLSASLIDLYDILSNHLGGNDPKVTHVLTSISLTLDKAAGLVDLMYRYDCGLSATNPNARGVQKAREDLANHQARNNGGGKNAKHASERAREAAKSKLDEAQKHLDYLKSKNDISKEGREAIRKAEQQVKHWRKKYEWSGEHHSQTPK